MADQLLNPAKALRTLRKTPVLLRTVVAGLTQTQAQALHDGPDGWSVLYIVCHLRDYEHLVIQRVQTMLEQEQPVLPTMDNAALIHQHRYADQDLHTVLDDLSHCRQTLLLLLEPLSAAEWERGGIHPAQGWGTVCDVAINTGLHDVDHFEQLVRCVTAGG
jgi:hypothetical protein